MNPGILSCPRPASEPWDHLPRYFGCKCWQWCILGIRAAINHLLIQWGEKKYSRWERWKKKWQQWPVSAVGKFDDRPVSHHQ